MPTQGQSRMPRLRLVLLSLHESASAVGALAHGGQGNAEAMVPEARNGVQQGNRVNLTKPMWIVAGLLFAAASIAINYQVKVRLNEGAGHGAIGALGKLKMGQVAPDFALPDLANEPVTLASFRGRKVVVLDFWATWCAPCRMAMPGLQAIHEELQDRGVELVSVNQAEPAERVRSFIERKKYTFRTVLDRDGAVANEYGVRAIPVLVVVDKQGLVRRLQVGYTSDDKELRRLLQTLLEEP